MAGRRVVVWVGLVAALWGWTGTAHAATVESGGGQVLFSAAPGEVNDLTLTVAASTLTFHDSGAPVTAGSGCTAVDAHTVTCPSSSEIGVSLNDGADAFTNVGDPGISTLVDGGPGADTLTGGAGDQSLFGGDGSDTLRGGPGNDSLEAGGPGFFGDSAGAHNVLQGGPGNDTLNCDCSGGTNALDGGSGNDRLSNGFSEPNTSADAYAGGAGIDTVVYLRPFTSDMDHPDARPRFISLDGVANDGLKGEKDNVAPDVEGVVGTWGPDRIIGNAAGNMLKGEQGPDVISGMGGDDIVRGGRGDDTLGGGNGDDLLRGGRGFDRLFAGLGFDTCDLGVGGGIAHGCEA
jgi:Ca2+-binding RTX toxin-like protein